MKKPAAILLVFVVCFARVGAQDTVATPCESLLITKPAVISGTAMMAVGATFTFVPELHGLCVDLRDAVQSDGHDRLTFDNYIQYVPMTMPFALKICGLQGRSSIRDMVNLTALGYGMGSLVVVGVKQLSHKRRPDNTSFTSFPSGHTYTAFVGAELLRREYGDDYPMIAVAGYAVATLTGFMRIYNNRHWASDVLAGAGLAIVSVNVGYWIGDKVLEWHQSRKRTALSMELDQSSPYVLSY